MTELVEFVRGMAEGKDLDALAERRAAHVLRSIAALEVLTARLGPDAETFYSGVFEALRGLIGQFGRFVTGSAVLAAVEAEVYAWASAAALTPHTESECP